MFEVAFAGLMGGGIGVLIALLYFRIRFTTRSIGLGGTIFYVLAISMTAVFILNEPLISAVVVGLALVGAFVLTTNYLVERAK